MIPEPEQWTGQRFGGWEVLSEPQRSLRMVRCRCQCGAECWIETYRLLGERARYCRACTGVLRFLPEELLHWHTVPWEHDDVAHYAVAMHPGGMTWDQIGELMGVSKQRAERIFERAIRKLQRSGHATELRGLGRDAAVDG